MVRIKASWEKFEHSLIQEMAYLSKLIDAYQKKRTANSTTAIKEWQLSVLRRLKRGFVEEIRRNCPESHSLYYVSKEFLKELEEGKWERGRYLVLLKKV